ncbi:MAG: DUF11 domain-containing protein [Actinomycetota bacterium]|nr:DUF11 domain-containing protein [Actinomycetota bacterium]
MFASAPSTQGTCAQVSASKVVCTLGTLTNGQTVTIGIQAQVVSSGKATNSASVTNTSVDSFAGTSVSRVTTDIPPS